MTTKADVVTGARHWWGLDGRGHLGVLAWYAAVAVAGLIAGAPIWLALAVVVPPLVGIVLSIQRRTVQAMEWREFCDYLDRITPPEQLPETD